MPLSPQSPEVIVNPYERQMPKISYILDMDYVLNDDYLLPEVKNSELVLGTAQRIQSAYDEIGGPIVDPAIYGSIIDEQYAKAAIARMRYFYQTGDVESHKKEALLSIYLDKVAPISDSDKVVPRYGPEQLQPYWIDYISYEAQKSLELHPADPTTPEITQREYSLAERASNIRGGVMVALGGAAVGLSAIIENAGVAITYGARGLGGVGVVWGMTRLQMHFDRLVGIAANESAIGRRAPFPVLEIDRAQAREAGVLINAERITTKREFQAHPDFKQTDIIEWLDINGTAYDIVNDFLDSAGRNGVKDAAAFESMATKVRDIREVDDFVENTVRDVECYHKVLSLLERYAPIDPIRDSVTPVNEAGKKTWANFFANYESAA